MTQRIEISGIVPCPEQKMDVPAEDCVGCEYYEGETMSAIICGYPQEQKKKKQTTGVR